MNLTKRLFAETLGIVCLTFFIGTLTTCIAKVELVPLVNLRLLGGQYFFGDDPEGLGGNFNLDITPAVKFSKDTVLIPSYYGSYRGTKDVTELVGGGTLYQQSQDHTLSLKLIQKLNE